jgi:hypothetical protein
MASLELRDHAQQILEAVAADLSTSQSPEEQAAKSMGLAPVPFPARETAAQTHAVLRAKSGYDIKQLVSEYRALRASVLSMWVDACRPAAPNLQDVIGFDEAIDQAVAESVGRFSAQVDQGAKPPAWHAQPRHAQPIANGEDDCATSWTAECRR